MSEKGITFTKGYDTPSMSKTSTTSADKGAGSSGGKGVTMVGNKENSGKFTSGANTNAPKGGAPSGKGQFISPAAMSKK